MSVKQHEAFSLDGFQDRLLWFDDFEGDQLKDEWNTTGTGSMAVTDQQTGGIVRLTTGAVLNNSRQLDWNNIRSLLVSRRLSFEIRLRAVQSTNIRVVIQLRFDGNNNIKFDVDTDVDNIWDIETRVVARTNFQSGVAIDADYHIFRIECHTHGGNHVHFYVDDVETANSPITTTVPTDHLQPFLFVQTRENIAKSIDIDYVIVRQDI